MGNCGGVLSQLGIEATGGRTYRQVVGDEITDDEDILRLGGKN